MPKLSISLPHQYDRAEARKRTEECVAQFQKQYAGMLGHLVETWDGDTMNFTLVALGMPVSGKAQIEDRVVHLEIDLPWLLSGLAGNIKRSIEEHGRKLLGVH